MMEETGQRFKKIRENLDLTYREVEEASARIAAVRQNSEYVVSLSRLADIENKGTLPSTHRLYSLCAIYRLDFYEVLTWFGIDLQNLVSDAGLFEFSRSHLVGFQVPEDTEVHVPIALDPGMDLKKTAFLSRMIQRWGRLPLLLFRDIDVRSHRYGLIGTDDWSMYPIIPPGSLVIIDDARRKIADSGWRTEFERPIYFLEHRNGYTCAWCTLREDRLTVQPHPASQCEPETYLYPREIEVIGQVTEVAMVIDPALRRRPRVPRS
jgi:transcriptional regulator with XRE-family HTH domain